MRKKISIGFISLAVLLLFAGGISVFELNRARVKASEIIEQGTYSASLTRNMLGALQKQNTSIVKMIAANAPAPDEDYYDGIMAFDDALTEAEAFGYHTEYLEPIEAAFGNFIIVVSEYVRQPDELEIDWFASTYLDSFYALYGAVRDYLASPHLSLTERTEQLEKSAYKTITPSIITLMVAILIVLMLYFFVDTYYVKPVLKINKGVKRYLTTKIPFDDSFEANDDITELKESITELIELSKK